jgi:hypothetical protein
MKKTDLVEGMRYWARIRGVLVPVRLQTIETHFRKSYIKYPPGTHRAITRYNCLNLKTKRYIQIKSAVKFVGVYESEGE